MIELFVASADTAAGGAGPADPRALLAEVRSTVERVIPPHLPPDAVLSLSASRGGVRVVAGEPVSEVQQDALDAIRARWPSRD